jgi:predicted amidohydrolase YtcJ
MNRLRHSAPVLLAGCVAVLLLTDCFWKVPYGDLVLKNAVVYTGNASKPYAEALVVRGERFLLVGQNDDVNSFIGPKTKVLDLDGRFVCAGFNDAHLHAFDGGKAGTELDLCGITTVEELQGRVLKKAWSLPYGAWLIGRGWDQNLFPGGAWPTRRMLDIIAPDVPMILYRVCGHAALVNGKALAIAGIRTGIPDPPSGQIVRDKTTGEPTGILKEDAITLVSQYVPALSRESKERAILNALDTFRRAGITSVQDMSPVDIYPFYEKLYESGNLTCRISLWFPLDEDPEQYRRFQVRFNTSRLHFGMLKGFVDGSMGARSAYFREPYSDDASTRGIPVTSQESLNLLVLNADRLGFQIGLHAIGDEAVHMAMNAYALARQINGVRDGRHRIEHAQVLIEGDMPRFNELGVVASMQPVHCIEDLAWAEARIGSVRVQHAYAWKSLLKKNAVLAFGSDWPFGPINPILGIYAAVTRQDTLARPAGGFIPRERISIREALDAYTRGSAYAERLEAEKGTIEKDKLADMVVLDRDILKTPPGNLLKTKVLMTICAGKIVYESK